MISVVMPYWRRPAALEAALTQYAALYAGLEFEVVIVDDGSPEPAETHGHRFASIVRLPAKTEGKNPCVPFNRGVEASHGEWLVLTNPECEHRAPILPTLVGRAKKLGKDGYVAAAAWSRRAGRWLCHPTEKHPSHAPMPKGAGLHFCAVLHRSLYKRAGGFDERYRDGQGFEDNDFLWRLYEAGAVFEIMADCVVDHPPSDTKWSRGTDNEQMFYATWKHRL